MSKELLRKSLSWLMEINPDNPDGEQLRLLKKEIAEELTKSEPEPVAWMWDHCYFWQDSEVRIKTLTSDKPTEDDDYVDNITPLYSYPQKQNQLIESETVRILLQRLGNITVSVGCRWRIDLEEFGICGFIPIYGETFEETLIKALKAKFGDDLDKAAAEIKAKNDEGMRALSESLISKLNGGEHS